MKLRFDKEALVYATSVTQGLANPQSTLPILGNILIRASEDGTVVFVASDLESCVRCTVQAEVLQAGSVTVPAKKFHAIATDMPPGTVSLDFGSTLATISGGGKEFNLTIQSPEDFPGWPDLKAVTTLELEQSVLRRMLNHVLFALPQRDPRKVLLGALFDIRDNEVVCVATDGKKLGLSRTEVSEIGGEQPNQVIIPGRILAEVQRNLKEEGLVRLLVGGRQVAFELGSIVYLVNRIEGTFPNYQMVIPQEFTREIALNHSELLGEIHRASLISEERNNSIVMHFEAGRIDFTSRTNELGSFRGSLDADYQGEPFDIAFNHVYLTESLRAIGADRVVMRIKQSNAPVVFVIPDMDKSLFLVMPIKLSDIADYQSAG